MKISINQNNLLQLEQVYLPITLVSDNKEEMTIMMRDSGFEFKYQGDWYSAKNGKVELMKKQLFEVSNDLPTCNSTNNVNNDGNKKISSFSDKKIQRITETNQWGYVIETILKHSIKK